MWKSIIAGTAALAIAGSSLVYAQQAGGPRSRPSAGDLQAFGEARLAGLKAGLNLTPEQEKNWPAFEQAARDFSKLRIEHRMAMRSGAATNDAVERVRRSATAMSETGAALKKLADATEPLYQGLDKNQKRRFAMLDRMTVFSRDHFRGHRLGDESPRLGGLRRTESGSFSIGNSSEQRM
jgi:zinc resistance-associated protein